MNLSRIFRHLRLIVFRRRYLSSKSEFLVWTHLGLGDLISVYPAIHWHLENGNRIHLPCKKRNMKLIREIYGQDPKLNIFEISDESELEEREVNNYAQANGLSIIYAGHYLYQILENVRTGFGINGLLNALIGYRGPLTSKALKERLLQGGYEPKTLIENKRIFVDHYKGSEREIPETIISRLMQTGDVVVNNFRWTMADLAQAIHSAEEIHLVSSAPLCLALTADLGKTGCRNRYRVGDSFPLRLDYPLDWNEFSIKDGIANEIDRKAESRKSLLGILSRILI